MKLQDLRPQRSSLVAETVNVMRRAIQTGMWRDHLPGERTLCAMWQISRPTLRSALDVLRREKLIEVGHGRRTRVLAKSSARRVKSLTVGLLSPEPLHEMPPFVTLWVDELRGQLAAAGHLLHVHVGRAGFGNKNPARALDSLVSGTPAAAWVLYQTTESMQRWFAEQKVPCVVVGSLFPEVSLPAVDRDYRAVCRHAVGLLRNRGHKHLAMLLQRQRFGGDLESELGFEEGLVAAQGRGVSGSILRHDGSNESICGQLDAMLAMRLRPTAMLIARSRFALVALTHLLRRGVKVPGEMSLLCRDDDSFLDHVVPRMARYAVNPDAFAKQVFRMVMGLVQDGQLPHSDVKVMPSFVARESL
jgi:DNA-binding LacI/PurR family transcriptional regulator